MTEGCRSPIRLETERLVLGPYGLEDFDALHRFETDPELLRLGDEDCEPPSPEETRALLATLIRGDRADLVHLAIRERSGGAFLGYGMLGHLDRGNARCRLGITIGEKGAWGKGYGTEAVSALLELAFDRMGLNRVGGEVFSFNERSQRLLERCGFRLEGVLRQSVRKDGAFCDERIYGILRSEWEEAPRRVISSPRP